MDKQSWATDDVEISAVRLVIAVVQAHAEPTGGGERLQGLPQRTLDRHLRELEGAVDALR